MKKITDIVVDFLESKNIGHVFMVSGGGCIHLVDSIGKAKNLKYVCNHHEQACAMGAEGYSRLSEHIGVCIVTTGPGGTNTLTGVLGAWLDSIPIIVISGQVSLSQISEGTGCRQIGDQEFDIVTTVKSMTKYATMIKDKRSILYELDKAYKIAVNGRPGPVWIDIPLDIQGSMIDENELITPNFRYEKTPIIHEQKQTLIQLLNESKKPLFLVGNGIRLSHSYDIFNRVLKKTKIPVLTSVHSGVDCVDHTYEYYAGRIGILGQKTSNQIVQECDLLIVLGSRLSVKMTGYNIAGFSPYSKKIYVDVDPNEINKHKFNIDLKIVDDLYTWLSQFPDIYLDIVDWQRHILELRQTQKYYYDKHINMTDYASAYCFIDKLQQYCGTTPIITSDGSAHVVTLQGLKLKKDQRLFTNVGCASMGYGLPAAIGASIYAESDVICIEGDGSLQMNLQELQTVKHYNLPIKLFVINNDGYLSIKITQQSFFGGCEVASSKDSGVSFPSLKKLAEAYNIPYFNISKNNEYDIILPQVLNHQGPCICELFTHPKEKHEPKVVHKGIASDGRIIPGELTDMYIDEFNL